MYAWNHNYMLHLDEDQLKITQSLSTNSHILKFLAIFVQVKKCTSLLKILLSF